MAIVRFQEGVCALCRVIKRLIIINKSSFFFSFLSFEEKVNMSEWSQFDL